jgi:hypothetical protein
MTRIPFAWLALPLLSLVALPGCGDDVESEGGGGATGIPIEDVPEALGTALCASIASCYGSFSDIIYRGVDCVDNVSSDIRDGSLPIWQADIAAGTVVYHGDKVQACADAIAAQGCGLRSERTPSICDEALEGQVAAGGACQGGVECAGPRYCAFTGGVCPGVCTDLEASGAACQSDEACQDGLVCLVDAATGDGVCGALGGEGDTCSGDDRCAAGASCVGADPATDTLGSCTSWSNRFTEAEGAACDPAGGQLCSEGLSCVVDGFVPGSGVTFSCSQPFASGAACQVGFPNACPVGEYCDADLATGMVDGMCMKSPTAGEPCYDSPAGGAVPACAPGLACNPSGLCEGTSDLGGDCSTEDFCHSGVCTSGVCAAPDRCQAEP